MISAIAFVLLVRDKYTISILSEPSTASAFGSMSFVCDEHDNERRQKNTASSFIF
jgi:hypothetical protein